MEQLNNTSPVIQRMISANEWHHLGGNVARGEAESVEAEDGPGDQEDL